MSKQNKWDKKGTVSLENFMAIADYFDITSEYFSLLDEVKLRTDEETRRLLLMQSFVGRAQNGNGRYCKERKVNTTMDDLIAFQEEIKKYWKLYQHIEPQDVREFVKKKRQDKIDATKKWVERAIKGEKLTSLVDENNKPLFGVKNFLQWKIDDPLTVLRGAYYGSKMDNYEWRKKVSENYGFELGGGICCAIDFKIMHDLGLNLEMLSKQEWTDEEISKLKEKGLIIDKKVKSTATIRNAYVRRKKGKGVSDDLAMVIAGMLHGTDALLGVFLVDAVDTWDKYTPQIFEGGQDEILGEYIAKNLPFTHIPSEEEVIKFIYAAALPSKNSSLSDNSQRYLLQIDQTLDQTALESHHNFIHGKTFHSMRLGHIKSKATNTSLYRYAQKKLKEVY